jgi:hypothetical protein
MANKEKSFNFKAYAIIVFVAILAALFVITTLTFKAKYTGFHPEEVARTYVDTIVQTGDGYNAYKNALPSKNYKYGDFIRVYYMYPVIYRDAEGYAVGGDLDDLKGYNDESFKGEKTLNDDGSLNGKLIAEMYPVYVELVANGWDDYNKLYTEYFNVLVEKREAIFGDKYMSDEVMFTALEANVKSYGESLTGTEFKVDENSGVTLSEESTGAYQTVYGEDYKFTTTVKSENEASLDDVKSKLDAKALEAYGVAPEDITEAKNFTVEVKTEDGKTVAEANVTVVKIKDFWYVDNTTADTTSLYNFYK